MYVGTTWSKIEMPYVYLCCIAGENWGLHWILFDLQVANGKRSR